MARPQQPPLGLTITRTSRALEREFDERLGAAGGSTPVWLILISLKSGGTRNQRELAQMVGIQGATLSHHLNAMESADLVTRRRPSDNRRIQVVEMTGTGLSLFDRLRRVAADFDRDLGSGIDQADLACFTRVLGQLYSNAVGRDESDLDLHPVRPVD